MAAPRKNRPNLGLRELAAQHGYTPGEFSMRRLSMQARVLKSWQKDLARGLMPAELGHMTPEDAKTLIRQELDDFVKTEERWMAYFYPKMQAVETDLSISGELSLIDLLKQAASGKSNTDADEK